jgi:hypothetical protein
MVRDSAREYTDRMEANGNVKLNLSHGRGAEGIAFCEKVLRLQDLKRGNAIVNHDYGIGMTLWDCLKREGSVSAYIGFTGQLDLRRRPGQYIADKSYGGSKEAMEAAGWYTDWLLQIVDPNIDDRAYTASWAETLLQDFVSKNFENVKCEWKQVEFDPLHGEHKVADNGGSIVVYMCIKYDN